MRMRNLRRMSEGGWGMGWEWEMDCTVVECGYPYSTKLEAMRCCLGDTRAVKIPRRSMQCGINNSFWDPTLSRSCQWLRRHQRLHHRTGPSTLSYSGNSALCRKNYQCSISHPDFLHEQPLGRQIFAAHSQLENNQLVRLSCVTAVFSARPPPSEVEWSRSTRYRIRATRVADLETQ